MNLPLGVISQDVKEVEHEFTEVTIRLGQKLPSSCACINGSAAAHRNQPAAG